ncbi:hypothetical protein ACWKSP_41440 [Micromonosporaceae bacterium Da 78-11]
MLHVRVIAPDPVTAQALDLLKGDEAVTHLVLVPGAALSPAGDIIEFDVVREGASHVLAASASASTVTVRSSWNASTPRCRLRPTALSDRYPD